MQMKAMLRHAIELPTKLVVMLVRGYQLLISPWLGPACRFEPTCSNYLLQAVHKYGLIRGVAKGAGRICRCHPWRPGGYDPP
jgi:putative membrane protein insertion efficiency factor